VSNIAGMNPAFCTHRPGWVYNFAGR